MPTKTKQVKKIAPKSASKSAPAVASAPCGCAQGCCCRSKFKKFIVLLIAVLAGFAICKLTCGHCGKFGKKMPRFEFIGECVDMSKIACPEMQAKVVAADANQDGCITREEIGAWKKSFRGHRGPKTDAAPETAE
ncbi:MAG: hypothetical protein LBO08_02100 [Rickettsiales bacterium]|jgi:hypothetical protein|nr:hypothetical protein [Rickettsiales bacterium]